MHSRQSHQRAVQTEQTHLDHLYRRLDQLRDRSADRLASALQPSGGTAQAAGERDSFAATHRDLLVRYDAVEHDLCFGRLDTDDGSRLHIGRIGLFDEDDDHTPLLTDWRAPAARPFYTATAVSPEGVHLRRTISTHRRRVLDVDEELLTSDGDPVPELVGEAALMAALQARRTGRMTDIVRTIQAEQDAVIRAPLDGVLVVQGGPGTGKTAVALHRAAYLLFTHRDRLSRGGVLLIGPTTTFLRYISQVLPSLAETGVLALTPGELFPGVVARAQEPVAVAEIKGRAVMASVIEAAVADRQGVPDGPIELVVDDQPVVLQPSDVAGCRARARTSGLPHNRARGIFARSLARLLARRTADRLGRDPYGFDPLGGDDAPGTDNLLGEDDVAELAAQLRREPAVRAAIDGCWPLLSPQRLLAELWASPERLAVAAAALQESERALLLRPWTDPRAGWTPADVPLLDEAAQLLGEDPRAARAASATAQRARSDEIDFARGVLQVAQGSRSVDLDAGEAMLQVTDVLDAEQLALRHRPQDVRTAAERAATDRTWTFGHVVVDEAQELSAMAWRVLMRRCPTRSMTVVGDLAQTAALGGATSWAEVFAPHVGERWQGAELTVCYRTPAEVMDVAGGVLARIDPGARPPRAVRTGGARPWARRVPAADLAEATAAAIKEELTALDGGTLGVLVATSRLGTEFADIVSDPAGPAVLLDVPHAKGLEFDVVLVVEPAEIVAEGQGGRSDRGRRGWGDLYVALTRPTQRLGVLYSAALPDGLVMTAGDGGGVDRQ